MDVRARDLAVANAPISEARWVAPISVGMR